MTYRDCFTCKDYFKSLCNLTLLFLLLAVPIVWGQDSTQSTSTYRFDIPAKPLMSALREFTKTTGHQVLVSSGDVGELRSAAVFGTFTAEKALTLIVGKTGLRIKKLTFDTFVLKETSTNDLKIDPLDGVNTDIPIEPQENTANAERVKAPNPSEIENIIIIGSKTGATRKELATSVGYFGAEQISNQMIFDVEDIVSRSANATTGSSISGAFSIRGVNTDGVAGSVNSSNALGSILINQIALGVSSGNYIKPSLFDADSVEVLRGPQSSLQGPNALIGSVYINYNRPNFDGNEGVIRLEAGELGTQRYGLMQNLVLAEDILAARLVLETRQSDGDVKNTTTGRNDVKRKDEKTIRLGLRWQPMGDEGFVFDLSYQHIDSNSNPSGQVVAPPGGDLYDREQPFNVDEKFPSDFDLLSLESELQINDRWRFSSVTGMTEYSLSPYFDGDLSAANLLAINAKIEEDIFSQELRFTYDSDAVTAIIGLFYSDADYENNVSGNGVFPDGNGGLMPFVNISQSQRTIKQRALFGNLTWRFIDDWEVIFGARVNNEKRDVDNFSNNNGVISDLKDSASFTQFIPSLTIAHDLNNSTRIGALYSRGFQAGGIDFAFFKGVAKRYNEEFADNYELFIRYESSGGEILLNANAFYLDWSDQQISQTLPGGVPEFDDIIINAGSSTISGLELESEWQPTDALNFFASLGYVDTEFKKFVFNKVDYAGTSFPQSPKYTANIGASYKSENGLFTSMNYSYIHDTYSRLVAPKITKIGNRNLLSGRFGYQQENWKVYLWGTNLLDDEYETILQDGRRFGIVNRDLGTAGAPRTLGIGFQLDW